MNYKWNYEPPTEERQEAAKQLASEVNIHPALGRLLLDRGITTAAGMWVSAAIGLACGAGMFPIALAATFLTLLCLEMLHFFHRRYGEKVVEMTFSSLGDKELMSVLDIMKEQGIGVETYSISDGKLHLGLRVKLRRELDTVRQLVSTLDGFRVEEMN